ncbi:MAG: ankyrin repeat domain-containing protein, partial [Bacteroidota bacterium]|nr:ankyrin repeat domain-containing protein [Bacteroidota bacterium]
NKIGETPLHWAVKGGNQNTEIIKKLLANGALVEAQTIKRQTVYDYAEDKSIRQLLKESIYR